MRCAALVASLLLLAALGGCPGSARDLSSQEPDADTPVPDAAVDAHVEAAAPLRVRIVNWNVQNFFNDVADSPELGGTCTGTDTTCESVVTSAEYQAKLGHVLAVLSPLAPDIAVMPEVENEAVATAIADGLGDHPHVAVSHGNDPRGIDVAVISRFAFDRVVRHNDEFFHASVDPSTTYKFARDCLELHSTINGRHVVLLAVHLKAEQDDASKQKRVAEAEQIRRIAAAVLLGDPSAAIVLLGDFNSTPDEPPMVTLRGAAPNALTSVAANVVAAERWSFGGDRLIDDQLLDAAMLPWLDAASVHLEHSTTVDLASDHSPLSADYDVR